MNVTQKGILVLLKSAVTGERLTLPEGFSLTEAVPMLREQHILSLAYAGAVHCGLPQSDPVMLKLLHHSGKLLLVSERQMQAVRAIEDAFERSGIDHMSVKGCLMKQRYPSPELRPMGDADILIRLEQYDRIRPIMTGLGFVETQESDHELIWNSPDLCVELHKRLIPSYNRDYYAYFGDGWRLATRKEGCRYAMSQEDEYIYLFTHFAKHYRDGGVGCRHVLDLWVMERWMTDPDRGYIRRELEKLRLDRFYENVCRVMENWFGDGPADEITELISQFILNNGSWGSLEAHVLSAEVRVAKNSEHSGTRGKSLLRTIFPPVSAMKYSYRILKTRPWMLPLVWVWRWITVLFFHHDRIRSRGRQLALVSDESVSAYQRSLNAVGLEFRFGD